ncbi:MAG: hypothetical protein ACLU8D_03205 [Enterocloster sp.]
MSCEERRELIPLVIEAHTGKAVLVEDKATVYAQDEDGDTSFITWPAPKRTMKN